MHLTAAFRSRPVCSLAVIALAVLGGMALSGEPASLTHRTLAGVVYLAPSDGYPRNLVLTDLDSGNSVQLTEAEDGVEDFAVSPDGSQIAYAHNDPDGTADIWVLRLRDGVTYPVTNCVKAICHAPAWKPDGSQIAYQRTEVGIGAAGTSASRAWIVDLATLQTRLLFDDPQILGAQPAWDPTGRRIAVFDDSEPGIRVHDFVTQSDTIIESGQDVVGAFSPDGTRLVYPVLVRGALGQQFYTHLEMADLDALTRTSLSGPDDAPVEDGSAVWSPDGTKLLVARRALDEHFTPGKQIVLLDVATGEVTPLVVDASYNHAGMGWDAAGRQIVFQRFSLVEENARPEVWVVDLHTGALRQVAENAFLPAWVP